MKPQKILIVEDSELLHQMYEVVFRQHRARQGVPRCEDYHPAIEIWVSPDRLAHFPV